MGHNVAFGGYEMAFAKRSAMVVKISTIRKVNTGFFIRKRNWYDLFSVESYAEIRDRLFERLEYDYEIKIRQPLNEHKVKAMKKYKYRSDFDAILSTQEIKREKNNNKTTFPPSSSLVVGSKIEKSLEL